MRQSGRFIAPTMVIIFGMLGAVLRVASAEPVQTQTVDCAKGQTVGAALGRGDERKPMRVVIAGTCSENVAITRSDVTLEAHPVIGGALTGPDHAANTITVTGNRVVIDRLTIAGGRDGVAAVGTGGLAVVNCTVQGAGRNGISYLQGASGTVDGSIIQGNGRDGIAIESASATVVRNTISQNTRGGVVVSDGGAARIGLDNADVAAGNLITQNGSNGIHVSMGSAAFIASNTVSANGTDPAGALGRIGISVTNASANIIGGNTITGHPGTAISVRSASVTIGDETFGIPITNTITGNVSAAGPAIGAFLASLVIRNAVVSDNDGYGIVLSLKSGAQIIASTIQNNALDGIRVVFASALFFTSPNTVVTGNGGWGLQCTDGESSVINTGLLTLAPPSNVLGGVSPTCTAF